jgi:MinD-like ATPase involved in chromosome partitioning or flagellar assembly
MSNSQFISIHSYRGGTGKSNITANLGVTLAEQGMKVGLVDMDIQSPGIHALFGFDSSSFRYCLNDYLWSRCDIGDAIYDLGGHVENPVSGELRLLPSSIHPGDIARIIHDGYDVDQLYSGLEAFADTCGLDLLLMDTHPGLGEETLLSLALSDQLLVLLRPDRQDYQGTSVTMKVAAQLSVPRISICINKAPPLLQSKFLRQKAVEAYKSPVDAIFYHCDEMMNLGSEGIFIQRYPEHAFSKEMNILADKIRK